MVGSVVAVSSSPEYTFSKPNRDAILLVEGLGVEGDAHSGKTVKHRSRARATPDAPNLRQVHLIHSELHDELAQAGFNVSPGEMGENITTRGLDRRELRTGQRLRIGNATVELTQIRTPCATLNVYGASIQAAIYDARVQQHDPQSERWGLSGFYASVIQPGSVRPGDAIAVLE